MWMEEIDLSFILRMISKILALIYLIQHVSVLNFKRKYPTLRHIQYYGTSKKYSVLIERFWSTKSVLQRFMTFRLDDVFAYIWLYLLQNYNICTLIVLKSISHFSEVRVSLIMSFVCSVLYIIVCPFLLGYFIVCSSWKYGFWIPLFW